MKLERFPPDPGSLATFYADALTALGAVVERSWYDQIDVLAEGDAARVWNEGGELLQAQMRFPSLDETGPRDAAAEVFPGCPATFRLAEILNPQPALIRRACLSVERNQRLAPSDEVAARTWAQSFPRYSGFSRTAPYEACHHFSAVVLVRCEIQAIDQVWSAHRVRFSLTDGSRDAGLDESAVLSLEREVPGDVSWPEIDPRIFESFLGPILAGELESELKGIRARQQRYLTREIQRIDEYFNSYERELKGRRTRAGADPATAKKGLEDRVAAARMERVRRRNDQVERHAIRVKPHVDAILVLAEPAWLTTAMIGAGRERQSRSVLYVPAARRWHLVPG